KMAQQGKFPKPVKFGRSSRWIEREVKEWLEARINDSESIKKIKDSDKNVTNFTPCFYTSVPCCTWVLCDL
ncbi:AlpA family phage regulatory protein, partial [Enterobacter hormaechei]|nr:AlpA family phage regulatory protein [Enterobacter hormaechei]